MARGLLDGGDLTPIDGLRWWLVLLVSAAHGVVSLEAETPYDLVAARSFLVTFMYGLGGATAITAAILLGRDVPFFEVAIMVLIAGWTNLPILLNMSLARFTKRVRMRLASAPEGS